jgi:hypothetical protein
MLLQIARLLRAHQAKNSTAVMEHDSIHQNMEQRKICGRAEAHHRSTREVCGLSRECAGKRRPCFAASLVFGQIAKFADEARVPHIPENADHHEVCQRKPAFKPLLSAKPLGHASQTRTRKFFGMGPAQLGPLLTRCKDVYRDEIHERGFDAVQSGEQPAYRARPSAVLARQESFIFLADMEQYRAGLEEVERSVPERRYLSEWLLTKIAWRSFGEGVEQPRLVRQPDLLACPSNTNISNNTASELRSIVKGGEFHGIVCALHCSVHP